jgi:hypothetical protein
MARLLGVLLVLLLAAPTALARSDDADARSKALRGAVTLGAPRAIAVSAREIVIDVPVHVHPVGVSGRVERVEFEGMALNGIPFTVEPYSEAFDLPDAAGRELGSPLRLRLDFTSIAPGLALEGLFPSDRLRLTGRVVLDGTFRKWIFSVKRSVAVPIDSSRPNPLADYHPARVLLTELRVRGLW